jgi:hypothetical protein
MPVKQTVFVHSLNAKRGSILMEDAGLTLNNKGEVVRTSGLYPSFSGTIVAAALLALADSSNKDFSSLLFMLPLAHASIVFLGTKPLQRPRLPQSVRRQRRQNRRRPRRKRLPQPRARRTALQKSRKKGSPLLRRRPALRRPKLKLSAASLQR